MILWRPVYKRASFIACSTASVPPLVKKVRLSEPGVISASVLPSLPRASVIMPGCT